MTEEINTEATETTETNLMGDSETTETAETEATEQKPETETIENNGYPEGFSANTYNLETSEYKTEAIAAQLKTLTESGENFKKQAQDLRKVVSKGKAPEDVADYDNYKPDSKYDKYYDFSEESNPDVKTAVDNLNELSKNLGLNVEQNSKMRDYMNETMEAAGVFNSKSAEEVSTEHDNWLKAQRSALGDNPEHSIETAKSFIENNPLFNEEQKDLFISLSNEKGAVFIKAMEVLSDRLNNTRGVVPTPNMVESAGRADLVTLAQEYNNPSTSGARRIEIVGSLNAGENLPTL